jgi:hypothetical protein
MTPSEEIQRAEEALQQFPADDPRRIEVLAIRAEARAKQIEDARREVHADVSDADLEARLNHLNDEAGEVAVAHAGWLDAHVCIPTRPQSTRDRPHSPTLARSRRSGTTRRLAARRSHCRPNSMHVGRLNTVTSFSSSANTSCLSSTDSRLSECRVSIPRRHLCPAFRPDGGGTRAYTSHWARDSRARPGAEQDHDRSSSERPDPGGHHGGKIQAHERNGRQEVEKGT